MTHKFHFDCCTINSLTWPVVLSFIAYMDGECARLDGVRHETFLRNLDQAGLTLSRCKSFLHFSMNGIKVFHFFIALATHTNDK